MDPKDVTRKLRAILSADVQGYSRLMGDDEIATVETITEYRETITSLVTQWKGRVVDSPGDNILAEFGSVVDAVQCAVEIQHILKAKNEDLPENRRMIFRIGVNLGDVIQEGDRIYGDGVNIAARIESLADGGGICISGTAYDQIKNKLALGYNYFGEHSVKNISEPVRVYKVPMEPGDVGKTRAGAKSWKKSALIGTVILILCAMAFTAWHFYFRPPPIKPASIDKMAFPLPKKPSIAVLPFTNMSDDPKQEYFSDGITEDLITDLSQISGLFIIARNSTFAYKGKPVKIQQVAEDLGVRYVLEGSVRKADNRLRVNAQLIDATTGHHLWAKRYDGKIGEVFDFQDKIIRKIVAALALKLIAGEKERVARKETDNILAYEAFLKGWEHYRRFTRDDFAKALPYFRKAIDLDPTYGRAHAALAALYFNSARYRWAHYFHSAGYHRPQSSLNVSIREAYKLADKYTQMAMKNPTALSYWLASLINLTSHKQDVAIADAERAIALSPNDPDCQVMMAEALIYAGRPYQAFGFVKRAMRLDPNYPASYEWVLGLAHFAVGELQEAANLMERAVTHNPDLNRFILPLAASHALLGNDQKAKAALDKSPLGQIDLGFEWYHFPFKDPVVAKRLSEGLRKAKAK